MLPLVCVFGCTQYSKNHNIVQPLPKVLVDIVDAEPDSVKLPFLFYPERWFMTGANLFVLNSKDTPFFTIYNFDTGKVCQWGQIGTGPGEYVVPSLCRMNEPATFGIYSNGLNKLDIYQIVADSVSNLSAYHFPIWNKERGLPKAYTRLQQVDDSLFVGTSFTPKEIFVELMDMKKEKLVDAVDFLLKPSEDSYSNPYECKISVAGNQMAIAYRYINRLEIYEISPVGFKLETVVGDDKTQETLCNQDRDEEMIVYYSDVICSTKGVYVLFQGVQEQDLSEVNSSLEIYDWEGRNRAVFDLKKPIDSFVLDEKSEVIYANDKLNPSDLLYKYDIKL